MPSFTLFFPAMQQLEAAFLGLSASKYLVALSTVVLMYDHIITLSDEIELVWSSPLSIAAGMFYVNRYVPPPIMLLGVFHLSPVPTPQSTQFCRAAFLVQPIAGAISYMAASWLLMLRVIALHRRSRLLAILLYVLFSMTHIVTLTMVGRVAVQMWAPIRYSPMLGVCISDETVRQFSIIYFALLPFEMLLIGIQIRHLIAHRHVMNLAGNARPSILETVYLDGSIYFAVVFGLRLWAAVVYGFGDVSLFYSATWVEFSLGATTISRLFLRLRRTARLMDGDSGVALSMSEPFGIGFSIVGSAEPQDHTMPSISRQGKYRVRTLSITPSLSTFWIKDVIEIDNEATESVITRPQY